jgi:Zn-dependent protease
MKRSLTIAKVAGVPIRVHWSFFLLIPLVLVSSQGMTAADIGWYALFVVALFVSVTLHELSHSVVAMRLGLTVRDIVLLPIGGVSEIEGMGTSAGIEGRVAIAGPLASILIGVVMLGVAALLHEQLWPPNLTLSGSAWPARIGWLNLALAAFNLLPAIPMDGGRVLRAALAGRNGNMRATRIASSVATVLAIAMIVVAVLVDDLFLILIGVFVLLGATSEMQSAKLRSTLSGMTVGGFMHSDPTTVPSYVPATEVAAWLAHFPGRAIPVVDEMGRYLGIVNGQELAGASPDLTVGTAADRRAPVLTPDMELFPTAVEKFQLSQRTELAVVADGRVVGVLYLSIVSAALMRARASGPGSLFGGRSGPSNPGSGSSRPDTYAGHL